MKVQLKSYNNDWYSPGGSPMKRALWYYVNAIVFSSKLFPFNKLKVLMLRLFGATVGNGVTIKPSVNIKYPWFITIGNHVWIGEEVWIDSLTSISIGNNVCLSQGAMILTGNHDYKSPAFDLVVKQITLEDGVWIGAKAVVCPGVTCFSYSILTVSSVATKDLEPFGIYQGNPAVKVKTRVINDTNL